MKIKAIFFDVDGTLFSSEPIIQGAYARAVREYNQSNHTTVPEPSKERIVQEIGRPSAQIYESLFPELPPPERQKIGNQARSNLIEAIGQGRGLLYPNVLETLRILDDFGHLLRLASNGSKPYVEAITQYYDLNRFFGPFIDLNGEDIRDKGDVLNLQKSLLNLSPEQMVMVGDRHSDLEAARKAGCVLIGMDYGHGDPSELAGAEVILHQFSDIPKTLVQFNR